MSTLTGRITTPCAPAVRTSTRAGPDRLRNPVVRLYGEYIWGYVAAIRNAPLSPADRDECYRYLARWLAGRAVPAVSRTLRGGALHAWEPLAEALPVISVDAIVAGRERRTP